VNGVSNLRKPLWIRATAYASVILLGISACTRHVTRIADGTARQERAISPEAYATFARARLDEAHGDFAIARKGYRDVLRLDAAADEAWI